MVQPGDSVSFLYPVDGRLDTIHGVVVRVLRIDGANVLVRCPEWTDDPLSAQSVTRRSRPEVQPEWWCWFRVGELTLIPSQAAA